MKVFKKAIIFLAVFVAAFTGGILLANVMGVINLSLDDESVITKIDAGRKVNVLIMGIDARSVKENSRSDTMIFASVDTEQKKPVLIWIPRDTRIALSNKRNIKINSLNFTDGPEEACKEVGKILNTNVDYYVIINFSGFAKIIDTLGGVDIDVETNMRHYDPDYPQLNINLSAGLQHLNGNDALNYVRYRDNATADIGRTQRQAKFVKAVIEQALKTSTILKLPEIIPQIAENIRSNIPLTELVYLATVAKNFDSGSVVTQTLPGYSFTASDGGSYWEINKDIAATMIADLMNDKTYDIFNAPPKPASQQPAVVTAAPSTVKEDGNAQQSEKDDSRLLNGEENKEQDVNIVISDDVDEGAWADDRNKVDDKDKTAGLDSGTERNAPNNNSGVNGNNDSGVNEKETNNNSGEDSNTDDKPPLRENNDTKINLDEIKI
ncbi:MAG: LCP family protein [Syntrophomonadaceae bacterium]|jgi:LCP family protein required for cell wall assembly|nr:LCP family protein [Syntrophomonadaceae bacterium]